MSIACVTFGARNVFTLFTTYINVCLKDTNLTARILADGVNEHTELLVSFNCSCIALSVPFICYAVNIS